jgi:30S ribosomal protein S31
VLNLNLDQPTGKKFLYCPEPKCPEIMGSQSQRSAGNFFQYKFLFIRLPEKRYFCRFKKNNYSFKIQNIMGKGDQKTKRGKIIRGSYGKTRPRKPGKTVEELIAEAPAKKAAAEEAIKAREAARKAAVAARAKQKKEAAAVEAKEKKEAAKAETATEEKKETKSKEAKPDTEAAAKSEEAKASKKEAEPKEKAPKSKSADKEKSADSSN